ncbi:hypothetical protein ACJJTC_012287 [Scirpophaga incertulas]
MEKRSFRVSPRQWDIIIDFIERNPSLARARRYNNSANGRAEVFRLWQQVTEMLNSQGSGTTKTYISNYKSKLKRLVADIHANTSATGGGPPSSATLSEYDLRFLAVMGEGFGQINQAVRINPFPEMPISVTPRLCVSHAGSLLHDIFDHAHDILYFSDGLCPCFLTTA